MQADPVEAQGLRKSLTGFLLLWVEIWIRGLISISGARTIVSCQEHLTFCTVLHLTKVVRYNLRARQCATSWGEKDGLPSAPAIQKFTFQMHTHVHTLTYILRSLIMKS